MYNEAHGRVGAALVFVGFNMTFFTQFMLGSQGMARRYAEYDPVFQPYHIVSSIGSFILGTSRMLAGSTQRKARRRETLTARFHAPELSVEPSVASGDIEAVERCLHSLAERDRRVLILTFYVEKTSSEIAEELGVTGTVVRVSRHRALERLRECVGLRGHDGSVDLRGTRTS